MEKIPHSRLRIYGLFLALGMGATAWVLSTRGAGWWIALPLSIGAPAFIFGLFAPGLLAGPYRASRAWGNAFGTILAWILMTPLYFLLFTPLAVLLRVFGGDHMAKSSRRPEWRTVPDRDNDPEQLKKLW